MGELVDFALAQKIPVSKLYAFFVLYVLHDRGRLSGYKITKTINEITNGLFSSTPGNIYPVLTNLEELRLIEPAKPEDASNEPVGRRKKILVQITPAGEEALLDVARRNKEKAERSLFFFNKVIEDASQRR